MSAETDFRALLAGNAGVQAVVGTRVALNAVPPGAALPYVAFTAVHNPILGLSAAALGDQVEFTVQCWANSAAVADQVADAVAAAVLTAPVDRGATVIGRVGGYDAELQLDATVLTVEWWP